MDIRDMLLKGTNEIGVELKEAKIENFIKYMNMLKEWNQNINLTAIEDDGEIITKHFLDSIYIIKHLKERNIRSVIDVGTGGGFPGVPIKIICDDIHVTLLDSLNKRVLFLEEIIHELNLKDINPVHGRAEDLGKEAAFRDKFDASVSRAVASLPVLAEYCLPFVRTNGCFISMKGKDVDQEVKEAAKAIDILGGVLEKRVNYIIPFTDIEHSVIIIKKLRQTPTAYPRKAGKPSKSPIM